MSETAACQPTQALYPVDEYWSPHDYWHAGSYEGEKMAITIPLPAWPKPPLNFSIQTKLFSVDLLNETIQPIVGGRFNCNALIWPAGHVYFEIHGIDSNNKDEIIDAIPLSSLTMPPSCLQVYDVSKYRYFYFKINIVNASHTGTSLNYCAAIIVPKGFIVRGTLPSPKETVNMQVYVYDASSMAPIPNATVTITDSYGYVNMQKITGSDGVAYFDKVPFSTADTYFFSVTASHYKSSGAIYRGQDIVNNNYFIRIGLTPEKPTVLSTIASFAKVAGVTLIAVGVAAAGLAIYKTLRERKKSRE